MPRPTRASCPTAAPGVGSVFHLTGELFNRTAGVDIMHVPYRGVSQPMQDTAAGHDPVAAHLAVERAGRAGVRQGEGPRHPGASALRQDAEHSVDQRDRAGIPQAIDLVRLFGPANMPPEIVARLNAEMRKAITAPDVGRSSKRAI